MLESVKETETIVFVAAYAHLRGYKVRTQAAYAGDSGPLRLVCAALRSMSLRRGGELIQWGVVDDR